MNNFSNEDYLAMAEFRFRVRQFLRFTERNAREANIHPQQHRLMLTVKGMPGTVKPNIRNLAERLLIEHHSAVELVNRAQRQGLVVRKPDPNDRRAVRVEVTAKGERVLAQLFARNKEELRSAAPALVRTLRSIMRGSNRANG